MGEFLSPLRSGAPCPLNGGPSSLRYNNGHDAIRGALPRESPADSIAALRNSGRAGQLAYLGTGISSRLPALLSALSHRPDTDCAHSSRRRRSAGLLGSLGAHARRTGRAPRDSPRRGAVPRTSRLVHSQLASLVSRSEKSARG